MIGYSDNIALFWLLKTPGMDKVTELFSRYAVRLNGIKKSVVSD